jgi:hypothetical protein
VGHLLFIRYFHDFKVVGAVHASAKPFLAVVVVLLVSGQCLHILCVVITAFVRPSSNASIPSANLAARVPCPLCRAPHTMHHTPLPQFSPLPMRVQCTRYQG